MPRARPGFEDAGLLAARTGEGKLAAHGPSQGPRSGHRRACVIVLAVLSARALRSPKSRGVGRRTTHILVLEPFGVPAVRSGAALSGLTLAPRVRIAPERSAFFSPRPPRLVGGRVSAPDPGLARGFSPGEVGRVRPSPDPLPALQGSPAVVRGGRIRRGWSQYAGAPESAFEPPEPGGCVPPAAGAGPAPRHDAS